MEILVTMVNGKNYTLKGVSLEEALDAIKYQNEGTFIKDSEGRILVVRNIESFVEKSE